MSITIHFSAERAVVTKTGETSLQHVRFDAYQTPTRETNLILDSADPIAAYKDWVSARSADCIEKVYDPNDLLKRGPVLEERTVNYEKMHLEAFQAWLDKCEKEAYHVSVFSL